jgi:hypothetical protein
VLTRTVDGEPALVEQRLDLKDQFYLFAGVKALARVGTPWADFGKFALPEPEDVRRNARNVADFPNLEIKLVGNSGNA